jgi:hypothetical protein
LFGKRWGFIVALFSDAEVRMASGAAGGAAQAFTIKGFPGEQRWWALLAAAPAAFGGDLEGLRHVLAAAHADAGDKALLPGEDQGSDLEASLWFLQAAHAFSQRGGDPAFVRETLLPRAKKIVQTVIAGAHSSIRMDDGGMLVAEDADALRLNGLWYAALETLGEGLRAVGDRAGDHFERLAGRFRRSFAKAYWCETHGSVCTPGGANRDESHKAAATLPAADQVLLSVLPASPIPKTKQRQALLRVKSALGAVGVKVERDGMVLESVVHRLWLARALAATAENAAAGRAEAADVLRGLRERAGARPAAYYRDDAPVGAADLLAAAELHAADA